MSLHRALRNARVLDLLAESEIEGLRLLGEERTFLANEGVFRDDDPAESLYIVLEGRVSSVFSENGQKLELARFGEGDHFGRVALLGGVLYYISAISLTAGRLFVLSGTGCVALLARMPRGREVIAVPRSANMSGPHLLDIERQVPASSKGDNARVRTISSAVAGLAHEINTPLGVIGSAASFITEQLSNDVVQELAKRGDAMSETMIDIAEACRLIKKNVEHAARLVQSFKNLSVAQLAEPREEVDLVRMIHDVLNVFRSKAISALPPGPKAPRSTSGQHRLFLASSRLDMVVQCNLSEADRRWSGFPGLFSRVLLNLLTNVDRYAYPGDREGRVEITLSSTEIKPGRPGFVMSVRDFGKGISPRDLPHVFDPFFTTGRDKGGTGLGLAMVHNLVTQGLGGTIHVRSMLDEGTTFEVRFPKKAPDHTGHET